MPDSRRTLSDDARRLIFDGDANGGAGFDDDRLRGALTREDPSATKRLTTDLDAAIYRRLTIACADLGCNKSEFTREVIEEALRVLGY